MPELRQFSRKKDTPLETPLDHKIEARELSFEPLSPDNAEEVEKLVDEVFAYEKGGAGIHVMVKSGVVEIVAPEKIGKDYNEHYWVVRDGEGKTVGITGFNEVSGDKAEHCWLGWFALIPELRGEGLGSALLEKVISEARSLKKEALYIVATDLSEMKGNEKFYDKNGCEVVEVIDKNGIHVEKETGLPREVVKAIQEDYNEDFIKIGIKIFIRRKELTPLVETSVEIKKQKPRETKKAL